jgi:hypothetical protein
VFFRFSPQTIADRERIAVEYNQLTFLMAKGKELSLISVLKEVILRLFLFYVLEKN